MTESKMPTLVKDMFTTALKETIDVYQKLTDCTDEEVQNVIKKNEWIDPSIPAEWVEFWDKLVAIRNLARISYRKVEKLNEIIWDLENGIESDDDDDEYDDADPDYEDDEDEDNDDDDEEDQYWL